MLKAISLFTGVGGLDLGFEAAGIRTAVALDLDPVACRVYGNNRKTPVLCADLADVPSKDLLAKGGLKRGEADLLFGGPPCQPFSKSGYWASGDAKRLDDPRAGTLGQFLRVLRDAQPRAFLIENVLGLAYSNKSEGLEFLRRGIAAINKETALNYSFHVQALNAADYGVPQLRERVFIVGSRDGAPFAFPKQTHAAAERRDLLDAREKHRTAWDAIGDLASAPNDDDLRMTGKWADLLPTIPEGQNYLWHTDRGGGAPLFGWRRRFWNFMLKLAKDQPAWTIQAQPGPATGPFHWRNRKLSTRELARLQTMPDDFDFECGRADAQRLIGNAVPSLMAEILGREIGAQLLGAPRKRKALLLLPPDRGQPPPAEKIQRLPKKYAAMIGEHEAHPGTGKGRGAIARGRTAA